MVQHTYMGNDYRRDHSFRVPRPDQSVIYHTPNACTNCHSKKSNDWAAKAIEKWYGTQRKYHFSDDLLPGSLINNKSEAHLVKLLSDTSQPFIARSTAAFYLGKIPTQNSVTSLLNSLDDEEAQVKYNALRSLENFNPEFWQQKIVEKLNDPSKAVRIAAADIFHRIPINKRISTNQNFMDSAAAENIRFLRYQTDFSAGNLMLGDYYLQEGNYNKAILLYKSGLKKDSLMNYARINLALSYNGLGRNSDALKVLLEAAIIDPKNSEIYFKLGLLYNEMEQTNAAIQNFEKALKIGANNPGLYYNYGLLLKKIGEKQKSIAVLKLGIKNFPQDPSINNAMNYVIRQ